MNVTSERWPEAITTGVTQPTSFPCMERGFYYLDRSFYHLPSAMITPLHFCACLLHRSIMTLESYISWEGLLLLIMLLLS